MCVLFCHGTDLLASYFPRIWGSRSFNNPKYVSLSHLVMSITDYTILVLKGSTPILIFLLFCVPCSFLPAHPKRACTLVLWCAPPAICSRSRTFKLIYQSSILFGHRSTTQYSGLEKYKISPNFQMWETSPRTFTNLSWLVLLYIPEFA